MITKLACFAILMSAATPAFAQDLPSSVANGSTAVLFSFSGLANLGANAFDGGIGAKWYWSDEWALRGGLQFTTASQTLPANTPAGLSGADGSISALRIGVEAAAERHLTKSRVSPFVGGGIGFAITRTESKNPVIGVPQTTVKNNVGGETVNGVHYDAGTSIGVFALGGVEFFVTKEVSLAAEYRLGFSSTGRADEERSTGNTTITTHLGSASSFGISSAGSLTLAVYF